LEIITANAATVSFPGLLTIGGVTSISTLTDVSFPVLTTAGTITADDALSFSAPNLNVTDALTLSNAKTVEVASIGTSNISGVIAVEKLTVNALNEQLEIPGTVITATINGESSGVSSASIKSLSIKGGLSYFLYSSSSTALVTLNIGGYLESVSVSDASNLENLNTTGIIDALFVENCSKITDLNLDHKCSAHGPGTTLWVFDNDALTSLTTSSDYPYSIWISDNPVLATVNFDSFKNYRVDISDESRFAIYDNALVGSYVPYKSTGGAGSYTAAQITAPYLQPIRDLVTAGVTAGYTYFLMIDLDDVNDSGNPLCSFMDADNTANNVTTNVVDATYGISSYDELKLVQ